MSKDVHIEFKTADRGEWIRTIHEQVSNVDVALVGDRAIFILSEIGVDSLQPMHIVTLACTIEFFHRRGYEIWMQYETPMQDFFMNVLQFPKYWYWGEKSNHVPARDQTGAILNLWRFEESEKESYTWSVHSYLKRRFFKGKDLGAAQNSLIEVFSNVSDHAEADGNAFSFIKFNEATGKLQVAVCDFGKGIARTVRGKRPDIKSNTEALEKAIENGFTVGSRDHNRGFGLDNIRMACTGDDFMRLFSNGAMLHANSEFHKVIDISNIPLNGTLVYYELTLSHFEDEEILDNFEFE